MIWITAFAISKRSSKIVCNLCCYCNDQLRRGNSPFLHGAHLETALCGLRRHLRDQLVRDLGDGAGRPLLLAVMGIFDLVGTTGSGWLTDRYDPRKLLFIYCGLRGLSLVYLPFSDFSIYGLSVFAVFYGLDWIATIPPTLRLATEAFGERDAPVIFGWIAAGHQLGAASAAFFAGYMRAAQGDYLQAFIIAGSTGVIAAVLALMIRGARPTPMAASVRTPRLSLTLLLPGTQSMQVAAVVMCAAGMSASSLKHSIMNNRTSAFALVSMSFQRCGCLDAES